MPHSFGEQVFEILSGTVIPAFNFVDIYLDGRVTPANQNDPHFFPDLHICDWIRQLLDDSRLEEPNYDINYSPDLLKGVQQPARTGNVTQEVQRISIAQSLGLWEDPSEFVTRMGPRFHGAKVVVRTCIEIDNRIYWDEPINRSEGIVKGLSRNLSEDEVVIEFTNSYGKLDSVKELSTTQGSLKRRNQEDTAFDRASIDINNKVTNWGGNR